jgi:hypothetical protein
MPPGIKPQRPAALVEHHSRTDGGPRGARAAWAGRHAVFEPVPPPSLRSLSRIHSVMGLMGEREELMVSMEIVSLPILSPSGG